MSFMDSKAKGFTTTTKTLPNMSDIFIAYSTVPGEVSKTCHYGSPFLIVLAKKLKELHQTEHLADLLTRVKKEMSEKEFEGMKQMPQVTSTLIHDVRLSIASTDLF